MSLRALTYLISMLLHGGVVAFFLATPGGASLDSGTGDDTFVIEGGIAVEGFSASGSAAENQELVDVPPPVLQSAPPVEEVKPVEEDVQHVIGSDVGPEQEKIAKEPEPEEVKEQPKPEQVATVQQTEIAVDEQKAAGKKQEGGDATAMSAYKGKIASLIKNGKKVRPGAKETGRVVLRFTVGPGGELVSREVAESSGSKTLDDAALASLESAAPFPPMPNEIEKKPIVLVVPYKFSVR